MRLCLRFTFSAAYNNYPHLGDNVGVFIMQLEHLHACDKEKPETDPGMTVIQNMCEVPPPPK